MSTAAEPMTDAQIEEWIQACNHEPGRQVLRDFLRMRSPREARPGVSWPEREKELLQANNRMLSELRAARDALDATHTRLGGGTVVEAVGSVLDRFTKKVFDGVADLRCRDDYVAAMLKAYVDSISAQLPLGLPVSPEPEPARIPPMHEVYNFARSNPQTFADIVRELATADAALQPPHAESIGSGQDPAAWPPVKKAIWHVVTGSKLNVGFVNAWELTDKLYAVIGPVAPRMSASHPEPSPGHTWFSQASLDVTAERRRQVDSEGWDREHDDRYSEGELPRAAAAYALFGCGWKGLFFSMSQLWPWSSNWWKPKGRRRNLVMAAALLIAEIERLDRAGIGQVEGAKA